MHAVRPESCPSAPCRGVRRNALCLSAGADTPQSHEVNAGFDAAPQSLYWYSEAISALNHDMGKDGFLLRVSGSVAVYEYAATDGWRYNRRQLWQFDLMPGYQWCAGRVVRRFRRRRLAGLAADPARPDQCGARHRHRLQGRGELLLSRMISSPSGKPRGRILDRLRDLLCRAARRRARRRQAVHRARSTVDGDTGYDAQRLGGHARYEFELSKGVTARIDARGRPSVRRR